MLSLYTAMMTYFSKEGVAKVKNLFAQPKTEQEMRYHLLSLMITVVFEAGVNFRELSEQADVSSGITLSARPESTHV